MVLSKALFSSEKTEWGTRNTIYQPLNKEVGGFTLDAATTSANPLHTPKFYTKEQNGLEQPWESWTFCNPPYGRDVWQWVRKAREEQQLRDVSSVLLLPARTDTRWFHAWIYNKPRVEIRFLKGRVKFIDFSNPTVEAPAPFPSMVVIFRGRCAS